MAGAFGGFALMLVATPVLVSHLGTANYGLWSIAIAAFGLMNVLEFGLGTAVAKYVAEHAGNARGEDLSALISIAVAIYLGLGLVLTVPLYVLAPDAAGLFDPAGAPDAPVTSVLRLVALGLLPMLLLSCGQAIAVGLQEFRVPMVASLAQSALTIIVALIVIAL